MILTMLSRGGGGVTMDFIRVMCGSKPRGHLSGTHRGSEREEDPSTPGDVREWQNWRGKLLKTG